MESWTPPNKAKWPRMDMQKVPGLMEVRHFFMGQVLLWLSHRPDVIWGLM